MTIPSQCAGSPKCAASAPRAHSPRLTIRCAGAPHPLRGGAHRRSWWCIRQKAKKGSSAPLFWKEQNDVC